MLRCKVNTDSNKKKKKTSDLLQYFQIVFDVKTDYYAPSIIQINIQIRICPNIWHIIENDIFY